MERITFDDLIKRKQQRDNDMGKLLELPINSMDGKTLVFHRLNSVDILNIIDTMSEKSASAAVRAYSVLIYDSCDMLHDISLHEALGIVDPRDVVGAIFTSNEILTIGDKLMDFNECAEEAEELENDIKN